MRLETLDRSECQNDFAPVHVIIIGMIQRDSVDTPTATLPKLAELEASLALSIRGKAGVIRLSLVCLIARGHLLIEDVPGVGKTTLAQALARSVRCGFHRLQFTSDMLPSDVLGVTIYNAHTQSFEFKPGPIFTNFLLADEINRATPKTQSALLEAMNDCRLRWTVARFRWCSRLWSSPLKIRWSITVPILCRNRSWTVS